MTDGYVRISVPVCEEQEVHPVLRLDVGLRDAAASCVVVVTHTSVEPEAHEPEERVGQAPQVSGVLGGAYSHVHAAAAGRHRHQESSHRVEQGGDPDHGQRC